MKATKLLRVLGSILALGLTLAVIAPQAAAQTVYNWDAGVTGGPNDGNGTWSPSGSNNWWTGSSNVVWPNTSSFAAQFGSGSGGTAAFAVSVDPVGVTAGGVVFQNQAYSIVGSTLTLGGSTPTVTVNASGGTIASVITGGSGLTKAGNGRLALSGPNVYGGPTIASAGTLQAGTYSVPVSDFGFDNALATGGTAFANNNNYRAIDYGGKAFNTPWTPTGSSWTFQNHAGIVVGNGGWTLPTPEPSGNQAMGLQYFDSTIPMAYQVLSFPTSGTYTINLQSCFSSAGNGNGNGTWINVLFNSSGGAGGTLVGSFIPASRTAWNPYSFSFSVPAAGNYEVAFEGYNAGNSNYISVIDSVVETTSTLPAGTALTVASGATLDLKAAFPTVTTVSSLSDATPGAGGTVTSSSATGGSKLDDHPIRSVHVQRRDSKRQRNGRTDSQRPWHPSLVSKQCVLGRNHDHRRHAPDRQWRP